MTPEAQARRVLSSVASRAQALALQARAARLLGPDSRRADLAAMVELSRDLTAALLNAEEIAREVRHGRDGF